MILNKAQAQAVYSAMCALNNVGGLLDAWLADGLTVLERDSGEVVVEKHTRTGERWFTDHVAYHSQAHFAKAYDLETGA